MNAKLGYERMEKSHGVRIQFYNADNLRVNDSNFKGSCVEAEKDLTFCAVGAHHQNAIAYTRIELVCHGARKILLHAKRKWSEVIKMVL